jgi:hypothetical protein
MTNPIKPIKDDEDENAHIDNVNPQVVHFQYSSQSHDFMKDTILKPHEGITHDVFKPKEAVPDPNAGNPDDQVLDQSKVEKDILETFDHVYVKEVVREPRIHYQKVPRLGSYMAVPIVYNSCLKELSLDRAVADYNDVQVRLEEQKKEKDAYNEELEKQREEREKSGTDAQDNT